MEGSLALDASCVASGRLRYDKQILFDSIGFYFVSYLCLFGLGCICASCLDLVLLTLVPV